MPSWDCTAAASYRPPGTCPVIRWNPFCVSFSRSACMGFRRMAQSGIVWRNGIVWDRPPWELGQAPRSTASGRAAGAWPRGPWICTCACTCCACTCAVPSASLDHAASASRLIDPVPSSSSKRKACMSKSSAEADGCSSPSLSTCVGDRGKWLRQPLP